MNAVTVCVLVVLLVGVQHVLAGGPRYRVKRVSDTILADLQSRIALNKMKGMIITMPVGGGRIDPSRIGRRRRSQSRFLDVLFNQSEEDKGDPVELSDYDGPFQRLPDTE